MSDDALYHIGFGVSDLPNPAPTFAFLSGDPDRAKAVAEHHLTNPTKLSDHRGLTSYLGWLDDVPVLSCTSGMGGPSTTIVVNELAQLGVKTILRIGTTGSIQPHVPVGDVIITQAALSRHGSADDIAPPEFPAAADPFLTVMLSQAADALTVRHHVGITASVDSFFEGQERTESSANPYLLRRLQGITEEYQHLGILNYEMESGTLFKMCSVYGIAAGCVLAVVAQRTVGESVRMDLKDVAIENTIKVAVEGARRWLARLP
jgi:uridine phosphorylase